LKLFLKAFISVRQIVEKSNESELTTYETMIEAIENKWIEAFGIYAVKTNETQLKKILLNLTEW
jgi:hypothetical protein